MEGKGDNEEGAAYEEFEPYCKWQRKEDHDILEIHLPEFKKEQLRVQITNHGFLKISGERPLDLSRKTKFHKEFSIFSSNYDTAAFHAKFIQGWLRITMPKRKIPEKLSAETPKIDDPIPKTETTIDQTKAPPSPGDGVGGVSTESEFQDRKSRTLRQRLAKVAVTLAATAAMMAVLVAYVAYMYKSTVAEVDD
ncbi:hypothetical protein BUALT_Bualt11G0083700 [Buddleja alternifolia]|uniref:SHSP domain-containing protein n=1 Tax=Buddleja alternifolia TaxID=168488 RepID=A0AAV6X0L3_9LAMI|nr:hypothetical protein BUALT_Bualt11G0083700 [Buddleja alternifolia]